MSFELQTCPPENLELASLKLPANPMCNPSWTWKRKVVSVCCHCLCYSPSQSRFFGRYLASKSHLQRAFVCLLVVCRFNNINNSPNTNHYHHIAPNCYHREKKLLNWHLSNKLKPTASSFAFAFSLTYQEVKR